MLLRALFWISVVAVLMPRESGFGFSHPRLMDSRSWPASAFDCPEHPTLCAARFGLFDSLQTAALRSLIQVKAELERREHMHSAATADD